MNNKVIIAGILGQDGPYLAKLLLEKGYEVYGMVIRHSNQNFSNTDFLGITKDIRFCSGGPDGRSFVKKSYQNDQA